MAQQVIGIGLDADDGTGDKLRTAGGKINDNFTELYAGKQNHDAKLDAYVATVPAVGIRLAMTSVQLQAVSDAIPADVTNAVHIRWMSAARVREDDDLYDFIKTTLSLSDGDMDDLMADAAAYD